MSNTRIFKDFDVFSRALVVSKDVDPVYPVVKDILKHNSHFQPEWFVFVYVAFYSLETAIEMCNRWPTMEDFNSKEFVSLRLAKELNKFGHERRGTCRNPVNQIELFKAAKDFISKDIDSKSLKDRDNKHFREVLMKRPWHGNWASFKIAELFEKSLGWENLSIQDLGIDERDPNSNDGPVGGLRWLFGRENKYSSKWFPIWNRFGERVSEAYGWDIGKTETCLCKFHKIMSGKYFVGHDIQEFVDLKHVLLPETYSDIMSSNFVGDFWKGIKTLEKEKKGYYNKTGEIINAHHGDIIQPVDVKTLILEL